jgi:hypothetical protein
MTLESYINRYLLSRPQAKVAKLPLELVKELLDGVQPRRVLCIQQDRCFHFTSCLINDGGLVNGCIVHQNYDVLVLSRRAPPETVESREQEVLEEHSVGAFFYHLH